MISFLARWFQSARGRLRDSSSGSMVMLAVMVIALIGGASLLIFTLHLLTVRIMQAHNFTAKNNFGAHSALQIMTERLVSLSSHELGEISQSELDSLETELGDINLPGSVSLDLSNSGYQLEGTNSGGFVPTDENFYKTTTDWPRFSYTVPPLPGGLAAEQTLIIDVVARVTGPGGGARTASQRVAVSRVLPYQYAVHTEGGMEVCGTGGDNIFISGKIRAEGTFQVPCSNNTSYAGDIVAQDSLVISSNGLHRVFWSGGNKQLQDRSPATFGQTNLEGQLLNWNGRYRLLTSVGARLPVTRYQTGSVAGHGECPDFNSECAGTSSYFPSVQLQRTTKGATDTFTVACGNAYQDAGTDCQNVRNGIRYEPWPFTSSISPQNSAQPDPDNPSLFWHGLFPDYRREDRCTAEYTDTGTSWRTFRCADNAYGYVIDMANLPSITGGVLSVLKASTTDSNNNPSGFQEVVLIKNGESLPSPLTIHSQLPVYIMGSYNNITQVPAMIDAPLITLLPESADRQLETSAVWDSVPSQHPHHILKARENHEVWGVLRANYHRDTGSYYGGTLEHIPSVLGDWSEAAVTVVGAVEGVEMPQGLAGTYSTQFAAYGGAPSGMITSQPKNRKVLHDPDLLDPALQPPGSWSAANVPASGAGGSRTEERQQNARGGMVVVRMLRGPFRGVDTGGI